MESGSVFEYNPHSLRLKKYDYTQSGAYFVTICTYARMCFFGKIEEGKIFLNKYGDIANSCWQDIPEHFPYIKPAPFVIMPNHIHGIIIISERLQNAKPVVETRHAVSVVSGEAFQKPVHGSLPTIVRSFKSAVTKRLNALGEECLPVTVWQRNYYEHVIRSDKALRQAIEYINFNPSEWESDKDNIENIK